MKKPILFLICMLAILGLVITGCGEAIPIRLKGKVSGINGTKVALVNFNNTLVYDSVIVENNGFQFTKSVPADDFYVIKFLNNKSYQDEKHQMVGWRADCSVYLSAKSDYVFKANGRDDILYNAYTITSDNYDQRMLSELNADLSKGIKPLIKEHKMVSWRADSLKSNGTEKEYIRYKDTIAAFEEKIYNVRRIPVHQFIKRNRKTLVAPYLIGQMNDYFTNYNFYQDIIDKLDPKIKSSIPAKRALESLKISENLHLGGVAPTVYGQNVQGEKVNYDFTKNKYTLISFWASYNSTSRKQRNKLEPIYKTYKTKGFDILAVSVDNVKEWWVNATILDKIQWPNISESTSKDESKNIQNYQATTLPLNFLIDKEGKIVARDIDLDSLSVWLQKKM